MRRALSAAPLVLIAAAACSGAQDGMISPPPAPCPTVVPMTQATPAAEPSVPAPPGLAKAEGTTKTVGGRDSIPLTGPRVDGKPGDLMLDNGEAVVVVTQEGRIADYGLRGERDELSWLNPTVSVGISSLDAPIKKLAPEASGKAIRLERDVAGKPLVLVSFVWLLGKSLHVESVVQSTGDDPALAVTLGERISWGNVPTWMDGHGYVKEAGKLLGGFLGRDALGVAYGLCSMSGPIFAKFDDQEYPGLFESARTGESVALVPARGRGAPRHIVLRASTTSLADAIMALPCGPAGPPAKLTFDKIGVPRAKLEVVRCGDGDKPGKPLFEHRGAIRADGAQKALELAPLSLPAGCLRARFVAPGHTPGPWTEPAKLAGKVPADLLPKAGELSFSVTEQGKPVPVRVVVRGEPGTRDPDWGDNADNSSAATNVLASASGTGSAPLPPGKYRVLFNRGFEYTASEHKVEIKEGKVTALKATLDRVVDTKGWLSADMHLHAVPSGDAPSLLPDRVRSLVAAGVEIAVATDHNAVTDYAPVIAELGLKDRMISLVGDEITTRDTPFGHFNAFPLDPKTAPFTYKNTTPAAIFSEVRASKPFGKETILQVNHPRMGSIGYFEILRFEPGDIPAWLARSPLADMGFDALEVFNGDHYTRMSKVEECLKDWYALLNAGYRYTATGNSDSHRVSFHDPGVPRSYVYVNEDDPSKLTERAFVDAVRAGHVVVSSGPFVTISAGDKGAGDTIAPGEVEIRIHIDGPDWVDIDEVSLVKRGETVKSWAIDPKKQKKRPFSREHKLTLKKDDWVIALARGKKPMTYLYRSGATPLSFTNPIFVK